MSTRRGRIAAGYSLLATMLSVPAAAWHDPVHHMITAVALASLPESQRQFWQPEAERLTGEYCLYPDVFANAPTARKDDLRRYCETPDGRPVHNVVWNRKLDAASLTFVLRGLIESIQAKDVAAAARFAGVLSHFIEDSTCPAHALEPADTPLNLLKDMVPPPSEAANIKLHTVIERSSPAVELQGRRPEILGSTPEAIAEAILDRIYAGIRVNRSHLVALAQAAYKNDQPSMDAYRLIGATSGATILSDALASASEAAIAACIPAEAPIPAAQRSVVVISLDGFPAYALDDPKLPIPTLRRLMREGASAARMEPINPTITWPNHTAMVTGVTAATHGLLVNGYITPTGRWPPVKVDPYADKSKLVNAVTVYDVAHAAGLTTAQVDWVAINGAPTITWSFPEWAAATDPLVKEMIGHGAIAETDVENFIKANIVFRDQIWTTAAAYLIREHKPNLLLFHLLTLDSTHHTYGPKTLAANDAIAFLDSCVARVLDAIREAGMADRTTVIVVSDHGFAKAERQIRAAKVLSDAGLADHVYGMAEGGSLMVYVDKANADDMTAKARSAFEGVEGIDKIAGRDDFAALGLPDPDKNPQTPALFVYAKPGYAFGNAGPVDAPVVGPNLGTIGNHAYLSSYSEMKAIFIANGYGIRQGAHFDQIRNRDVASTIAALLGVSLPASEGSVPNGLLKKGLRAAPKSALPHFLCKL